MKKHYSHITTFHIFAPINEGYLTGKKTSAAIPKHSTFGNCRYYTEVRNWTVK